MFFRKDYQEPGPGIDPNAPEKTGAARFFEIVQLECGSIIKVNLLFLISCLPVVTIPLAVRAMYQVICRMVRDQPVDCFYHYRTAFRQHVGQAYAAFLLSVAPLAISGYGALFYLRYAGDNYWLFLPFMLCSTVFLTVLLASTYLYGVLSSGISLGETVRLALALGIGRPRRAVLAALFGYGPLLAAVLFFPFSALYLLLVGFSLPCLLSVFFIRTVMKRYCGW